MEGKVVKFRGRLTCSGTGERGEGPHGFAEVPEISRINPGVVAQILAIRENLVLTDPPVGAYTEQSVAMVDLESVLRWLEFADSGKVLKYPSFYVRVLNRLMELRPDLFGELYGRIKVGAVQESVREQIEIEFPKGE